jgi:hypothetical protein
MLAIFWKKEITKASKNGSWGTHYLYPYLGVVIRISLVLYVRVRSDRVLSKHLEVKMILIFGYLITGATL